MTDAQIAVLRRIAKHGSHRAGLRTGAEHSAATRTCNTLERAGLTHLGALTDAGRKALADAEGVRR